MTKADQLKKLIEAKSPNQGTLLKILEILPSIKGTQGEKGEQGNPGYTPSKGQDYFTEEEINTMVDYIQSKVKDGEMGPKGERGEAGKNGITPVIGIDYWTDKDQAKILKDVLSKVPKPKDGVTPNVDDLVQKVKDSTPPINFKDEIGKILSMPGFRMLLHGGGSSSGGSSITLQTNGTPNGSQTLLNLVQGTGMTITDDGLGNITFVSSGTGISFGTDTQIPFMNATNDDFNYSSAFAYDGSKLVLTSKDLASSAARVATGYFTNLNVASSGALTFVTAGSKYISISQATMSFNDTGAGAAIRLVGATMGGGNQTITLPDATGTVALTSDLTGYVPTSRTLTINGSTQDLSANRTYTITTTGTSNRISVSGGAGLTPTIDIDAAYVGQASITTLGTITTGVWNATDVGLGAGGTGATLSDPGANNLWGWDDTDNSIGFWTIGTGLTYTHATHTLSATGSGGTVTSVASADSSITVTNPTSTVDLSVAFSPLLTVANEATDTTCFIGFYTAASGNLGGKTNTNLTFNSNTGVLTSASSVLTTTDINGGTIDGTVIGGSSAAAGTFTAIVGTSVTDSGLTAGRVTFAGTGGLLADDPDFTFATDTLTVTKIAATQFTGNITIADGINVVLNTTTGTKIGTGTTQKLGFFNSTPVVQQTGDVVTGLSNLGLIVSGTVLADTVRSANEATDTTCFPLFITASGTQTLATKNNAGFIYNSNTNALTATTFIGALNGNADTITVANEATDATSFIGFYTAASGSLGGKTNANMTFDASTGIATFASTVLTTTDINGGTVDGTVIGGSSAAAGTFTTAVANSFVPNANTVPTNGMYLPAANTLGWAINSAAELQLTGTALSPAADGGSSLGTTALGWQNLFANTGFVLNIENSDWVATHTAGILTVGTGDLRVTNNFTNATSVVTLAGAQTLTNKTFAASSDVLGKVTMTLGSDADGDVYYRASGLLTRLGIGSAGQVLAVNAGATAPQWSSAGSGTVTNTGGNLTSNAVVLGAGTSDVKVVAGITTNGTAQLVLGVNTTTLGNVKMFGSTSGDVTMGPAAVAGTATVFTLPASNGSSGQFLQTNGSGITSWQTASGGGMTWTEVTGASQSMAVGNGYILNNAGLVTATLPATAAVGDMVAVVGKGAGGWRVAQNAGDIIHFGNQNTTTGTGGRLDSVNRYDVCYFICIVANDEWVVTNAMGNITVT